MPSIECSLQSADLTCFGSPYVKSQAAACASRRACTVRESSFVPVLSMEASRGARRGGAWRAGATGRAGAGARTTLKGGAVSEWGQGQRMHSRLAPGMVMPVLREHANSMADSRRVPPPTKPDARSMYPVAPHPAHAARKRAGRHLPASAPTFLSATQSHPTHSACRNRRAAAKCQQLCGALSCRGPGQGPSRTIGSLVTSPLQRSSCPQLVPPAGPPLASRGPTSRAAL